MDILNIVGALVHHHRGMKQLQSARANESAVQQNGALSPVWVIYTMSPANNLYVRNILFHLPFG